MPAKTTPAGRAHLLAILQLLGHHAGQLDYPLHDQRDAQDAWTWGLDHAAMLGVLRRGGRLQFDCSQMTQQAFRWADLSDPCGLGFAYAGATGAMLQHLPHFVSPSQIHPGTLIIYGPGAGDHVSIALTSGPDPLLASHGRSGWDVVHLSAQRTWHRPPVTFLSIAQLG